MVTQPGVEITWGEVHVGWWSLRRTGFTEVSAPANAGE